MPNGLVNCINPRRCGFGEDMFHRCQGFMLFEKSSPNVIQRSVWRSCIYLRPTNSTEPLDAFVAAFSDLCVFRYITLYRDIFARHNDDCSVGRTAERLTVCAVTRDDHIWHSPARDRDVSAVAFTINMNLFNQGLFLCKCGRRKQQFK